MWRLCEEREAPAAVGLLRARGRQDAEELRQSSQAELLPRLS